MINLIYVGEHFYRESKSIMSSIYTEDGRRYDWGFVQMELRNGNSVTIRPATEEELSKFQEKLAELQESFKKGDF